MDPKKKILCGPFFLCILLRLVAKAIPAIVIELVRLAKDVHRGMWRRSIEEIHVILQSISKPVMAC